MENLTLNTAKTQNGLGCLNGLFCPECNAPMVDTLRDFSLSNHNIKDCLCPMCDYEGQYFAPTKTITVNLNK